MVSHMVIKHAPYSIISFQKFVGSDSDDTDEEDSDDTEEREKFVVFFGGASSEVDVISFWRKRDREPSSIKQHSLQKINYYTYR